MKRKIATLSFAAALLAGALFAQRGFRGPGRNGTPDALKSYLELSDQQVQDLQNVEKSFRDAARPTMEQIRDKMQTLRETRRSGGDVTQLQSDLTTLQEQVKKLRDQYRDQSLAVLTETQKTKLTDLENALKLMPAAQEALGLNLLEAPEGMGFPGGPGRGMMRRRPGDAPPIR